jgi:NAD(P)-dependent dehydrogenase (short-subunit alcohol dehydrogenase family)
VTKAPESLRVLISGAAGGVGLACAEAFAASGAELILADCDGVALTRAADRLDAFSRFCDVIGSASVEIFAEEIAALFPHIDVLINAAGRGYVRALGMTKMARALLPLLRRGKGQRWIVNVECVQRPAEPPSLFAYASSPPAFRSLSHMFEEQLRGSAIDVLTIVPRIGAAPAGHVGSADQAVLDRANALDTAARIIDAVSAGRPGWAHKPQQQRRRRAL